MRAKWKFQKPPAKVLYIGAMSLFAYVIELADARAVRPMPGFSGMSADIPASPPRIGSEPISFRPSAPIMYLRPNRSSAT